MKIKNVHNKHCVKSVRIWDFSGPYFPAFGLNLEILNAGKCAPENMEYGDRIWRLFTH